MGNLGKLLDRVVRAGTALLGGSKPKPAGRVRSGAARGAGTAHVGPSAVRSAPTGQFARTISYAPRLDGAADPGEVVWAWVPYEENDGRGKDRPLLVVGRLNPGSEAQLLALMLSSQHDRSGDSNWLSVGSGAWDRQHRESFVRLDRILQIGEHAIRREGAVLPQDRFANVAGELRSRYGWR